MKILGLVCSPRKSGNTEILVNEALTVAQGLGAETELIRVSEKNIKPCDGCESCAVTGKCKINDDMQEIYSKMLQSDGIIIGSPVYFWGVTAQCKAVIDRTFPFRKKRLLRNKVAAAVIVARDSGSSVTFSALTGFFNLHRMVPARSISARSEAELAEEWGGGAITFADKRGDAKNSRLGMARAHSLGRNMVETIQLLHKA